MHRPQKQDLAPKGIRLYSSCIMATFAELQDLTKLIAETKNVKKTPIVVQKLVEIDLRKNSDTKSVPLYSISYGNQDPSAPCLIVTAGVHGLERVGSHVCIQHLIPFTKQLDWNLQLQELLKKVRLSVIPIVNPGGMFLGLRSNPSGVDIMRNADIESQEKGLPLISGHRLGPWLPWFRGIQGASIEIETKLLFETVQKNIELSEFAISLDIHSGFGLKDRIWYPWSNSKEKIPDQKTIDQFEILFKQAHPYHFYQVESQTESYVIQGDPWDWLYAWHLKNRKPGQVYLPLTLELGSWTWIRKNLGQFFRRDGIYNPIIPHRYNRIMRRHRPLIDFLLHLVANHKEWKNLTLETSK